MKVVLSLESGLIPPSIGVLSLNPAIEIEKNKVEVVTDLVPWPQNKLKRASINSFGFGGANGHCIVDHVNNVLPGYVKPGIISNVEKRNMFNGYSQVINGYPKRLNGYSNGLGQQKSQIRGHRDSNGHSNGVNNHEHQNGGRKEHVHQEPREVYKTSFHHPIDSRARTMARKSDADTRTLVLLPFSAHNEQSLKMNMSSVAQVMKQHSLADLAYTLTTRRSKLLYRSFMIVEKDLRINALTQGPFQASSALEKIAFVFTGQGAQWYASKSNQLVEI
jgi:acyl transferase domain-containing protein